MNEKFGSDLRVIGEMTVTGIKVGMGASEYAYLAHHEEFFGKMTQLIRHQDVLDKVGIDIVTPINKDEVELVIQDIMSVIDCDGDGCIPCSIGGDANSLHVLRSYAETQDIIANHHAGLQLAFCSMIENKLFSAGIHPAELAAFSLAFEWDDESSCLRICRDKDCYNPATWYFSEVLRDIVKSRRALIILNSFREKNKQY